MTLSISYTLLIVSFGTVIIGITAGILGCFAVLRQQSLLGDAISHAALPGIGLAFFLTLSKHPLPLLIGALISGWLGMVLVNAIVRHTIISPDAALGIILSVFFGFGLLVLTAIQKIPTASQAGLTNFLFGSASTLLIEDVIIMSIISLIVLCIVWLFWKEFKVITFDPAFSQSTGVPVNRLELLLTSLIVITIVIGLQTVGVVLMSALIIAPASAARQWTNRLGYMIILSAFFGAISGLTGAIASSLVANLPTGPVIVLIISLIVFVSILFAPNRGIIFTMVRSARSRHNIRSQTMLTNLLLFSESETDPYYPHDIAALTAIGRGPARRALQTLKKQGYVVNPRDDQWGLTPEGLKHAKHILSIHQSNAS